MITRIDDMLNYIGASMRWGAGIVFETIFSTKKLTFDEILNGPADNSAHVNGYGHRKANRSVGLLLVVAIIFSMLEKIEPI